MRFLHAHGVKQEALRAIALASYHHAQKNPAAVMYGRPLDEAKYDASRWIAEPHHLYVVVDGSPPHADHVCFRDYLRQHSDVVQEYAELKKGLASQHREDPLGYTEAKDEFVAAAQAITTKAGVPGFMVVQGGGGANFLLGIEWATTFYQAGGEWTNADYSQSMINSQAGVDSSNFWKSLVDQGISPKGTESDTDIAAFKQGKNGMVMSGIWETNGYIDALKDDLGAGPVPQIFGKGEPSGSPVQTFGGVLAEAAQCTPAHGGKRPARMHALGHKTQ